MSKATIWGKDRAEAFTRPKNRRGPYPPDVVARRTTADWAHDNSKRVFLDLGAGPGTLLVEVKRLFPEARVIGVDPSKHMLSIARRNAESAGFADIETMLGMAEEISVDPATVDLLVARFSLHDWDDAEKGLSEIHRVLKPDGKLAIIDWDKSCPRWNFYLDNLRIMRRTGWWHAREARNSYRRSYQFDKVLCLLREHNLEPVETERKEAKFFITAIKANPIAEG